MRNKVMVIVLICSSCLILASAIFLGVLLHHVDERPNTVRLDLEGKAETVEFRGLALHPGESIEYNVDLTNEVGGKCQLSLNFREFEPETRANELQNYVYALIALDGEEVGKVLLKNLLEGELPPIDCTLDKHDPVELKIIYFMPLDIGNEAENTDALFDLVITASNE